MRPDFPSGRLLTVIFAGYEEPLVAMLGSNQGLRSLVSVMVRFAPLLPLESGQLLLRLAHDDGLDVAPGLLDCWLAMDLVCALPMDGRSVETLYQRLLCGPIAERACTTQRRLSLQIADLGEVLLPLKGGDVDTDLVTFSALDDEPS